jgi:hypothetical protein
MADVLVSFIELLTDMLFCLKFCHPDLCKPLLSCRLHARILEGRKVSPLRQARS